MKEPEDVFFSKEQIEQSIKKLDKLHPFFGTVFLAFKKAELPIGKTTAINFKQVVNDILQAYYPFYRPTSDIDDHRIYTPFRTQNKRSQKNHWNKEPYTDSLDQIAMNTGAVDHPGGSQWGWKANYIDLLKEKRLKRDLIPAFDLAVWIFREQQWDKNISPEDVINTFFGEFNISHAEKTLFNREIPALVQSWLQAHPLNDEALLEIIGFPGGNVLEGATLQFLKLSGIGPAKLMECQFAPRLNVITGDNGLGKTFLLETAWWALTGNWNEAYPAQPRQDVPKTSVSLAFRLHKENKIGELQTTKYQWDRLGWRQPEESNMVAGLSVFAHVDGSFAMWDPTKRRLPDEIKNIEETSDDLIHFSHSDLFNGIVTERQGNKVRVICNGLIRDWITWQISDPTRFEQFCAVLKGLSSQKEGEQLIPGSPQRLPDDARLIPTLKFSYDEVPIVLCSAGIQRIVSLAYLLVWAWNEHVVTARLMRKNPQYSIILLIDEIEAHLHPYWQRTIVPALLNVVQDLAKEVQIQILITTHSPLVLASLETVFDKKLDNLFHFHIQDNLVQLDELPFIKRGRVDQWLTSDIFGLGQPRSIDAEKAIEVANKLQLTQNPPQEKVQEVSDKLLQVLAPDDEFWPLWTYFAKQKGVRFDAR